MRFKISIRGAGLEEARNVLEQAIGPHGGASFEGGEPGGPGQYMVVMLEADSADAAEHRIWDVLEPLPGADGYTLEQPQPMEPHE
jgi:hypothetical protein